MFDVAHSVPRQRGILLDVVTLIRLPSVVAGAVEVVLGGFLANGVAFSRPLAMCAAALSMALCVATAMAFNDIVDRHLDSLTKPTRPLPSGRRSVRWAGVVTGTSAALAVASAVVAGVAVVGWCAGLLAASIVYSRYLKSVPVVGNLSVALCASTPVIVGADVSGDLTPRCWAAAGLVLVFMFCYEVLKTIADEAGDQAGGIRTITTVFGAAVSTRACLAGTAVVVGGVLAAATLTRHVVAYALSGFAFASCAVAAAVSLAAGAGATAAVDRAVTAMRAAWIVGLLTLWFLR